MVYTQLHTPTSTFSAHLFVQHFQKTHSKSFRWATLNYVLCPLLLFLLSISAYADTVKLNYGVSRWNYDEPIINVHNDGWLSVFGAQWEPTPQAGALGSWQWQATVSAGKSDYEGSGVMKNQGVVALRLGLGYDIPIANTRWSWGPLLSFDHLYNDGRGLTSTNKSGYRRLNQRWSAGLQGNYQINDDWKFNINLIRLLQGKQISDFADAGGDYTGVAPTVNTQRSGGALKLGICRAIASLRLCSEYQDWLIQSSNILQVQTKSKLIDVYEPANRTRVLSLTIEHRFD